jgi:hypothetical protein
VPTPEETIRLYAQLAEEHQKRDRPQERDRFLLLAAEAALSSGRGDVAENFRRTLLARNPNHLLKPYASLAEALQAPDIANYVQELRRTYPPERLQREAKSPPGGTALTSNEGREEFILPLDYDRTKPKTGVPFQFDAAPLPQMRAGGRSMTNSDRPLPSPRAPQPQGPQPLPLGSGSSGPGVFSLRPEPVPSRPAVSVPLPRPPLEEPSGGWMGAFLFFVAFLGAIALFGWVFVKPFLTAQ